MYVGVYTRFSAARVSCTQNGALLVGHEQTESSQVPKKTSQEKRKNCIERKKEKKN